LLNGRLRCGDLFRLALLGSPLFVSFLSLGFLLVFFDAVLNILLQFSALAHGKHIKLKFKYFALTGLGA